jgi:hypothetical protein
VRKELWRTISWNEDYEISTEAKIRRRTPGTSRIRRGDYLLPFIGKNKTGYYNLDGLSCFLEQRNVKKASTSKQVKLIMFEIWPEVAEQDAYNGEWVKATREWVLQTRKVKDTEKRKYMSRKITGQKVRACRRCGKPSGVNYWCRECHIEMADYDSGYPVEGYSVGGYK